MSKSLADEDVQQAIGRILADKHFPGDGNLLLQALENERAHIPATLPDACALSAGWGRRKLAADLIEIARKEYQRVHTRLPSSNAPSNGDTARSSDASGFGSGSSSLASSRPGDSGVVSISTRRHGPIFERNPSSDS